MPKRLIVCCDGTWNDPEDKTNIAWLSENIVDDGTDQLVFYDTGVGTKWYDEKAGGIVGAGLSRNVRQAYRFIRTHYQPGDEVYAFGFSRGAFTARSLCGFIGLVGYLEDEDDVTDAYRFYRINEPDEVPNLFERLFQPKSTGPIPIKLIGVFDTVGSLGLPLEISDDATQPEDDSLRERIKSTGLKALDWLGDRLRRPITRFHDTTLGSSVEHAYHALALDEARAMFAPTLWTAAPGQALTLRPDRQEGQVTQKVEQVWFAGSHSDVGGGYQDEPRLADVPLLWMVEKAASAGLRFKESALEAVRQRADTLAPQHDSMSGFWRTLHATRRFDPILRPITNGAREKLNPSGDKFPKVQTPESVHPSVHERYDREIRTIAEGGSSSSAPYRPENLA